MVVEIFGVFPDIVRAGGYHFGISHRPSIPQIPMLVINKLEIRQGELLLEQRGQFLMDGLGPLSDKDDKLIDIPNDVAAAAIYRIILPIVGMTDDPDALLCGSLDRQRRQLLFPDIEQESTFRIIPERAHAWHLFIEGPHVHH